MELISYLKADHKNIRRIIKDFEQSEDFVVKRAVFEELVQLIKVHFKAEEVAVYAVSLKKSDLGLNESALKGFEEHNLIEELLYKIKNSNKPDMWDPQARVFCQVLDMHLSEEETEYFPQLLKQLDTIESERAAVLYLKVKKSEAAYARKIKKDEIEKVIQIGN